ncbi:hypothetical protein NESM_000221300 [Novymonas esmeraldas]|uniref:SPRY domain-containing protein n=1 Tax=Novymonas esmeraldas TaxID=1808958 RepID=A0AAW0F9L5_9TRYP
MSADDPAALPSPPPVPTPRSRASAAPTTPPCTPPRRGPLAAADVNVAAAAVPAKMATPEARRVAPASASSPASRSDSPAATTSIGSRSNSKPAAHTTSPSSSPSASSVLQRQAERKHALQRRLSEDAETRLRHRIAADEDSEFTKVVTTCVRGTSASAVSPPSAGVCSDPPPVTTTPPPQVTPRRLTATPRRTAVEAVATSAASSDARVTDAEVDQGPAVDGATSALPLGADCVVMVGDAPQLPAPAPPSVSPLTSPSAPSVSSADEEEEAAATGAGDAHVDEDRLPHPTPAPARVAPRSAASPGSSSAMVAALRARLVAASSRPCTPRSSTGGASACSATPVSVATRTAATAANTDVAAAAAAEVKELRQALKDKERELDKAVREAGKSGQAAEKTQLKSAELQSRLEAEKAAFAEHKREAQAQRLALQKELRVAQSASRAAEQAQERLQRELEKQREKLTASSAAGTPLTTPRQAPLSASPLDAVLKAKVASLEMENASLKGVLQQLEDRAAAAAAEAAHAASVAEDRLSASVAATTKEVADLQENLARARREVAVCEATIGEQREQLTALADESARQAQEQAMPSRSDAAVDATAAPPSTIEGATSGSVARQDSPPVSPRQVVTADLTAVEEEAVLLRQDLAAALSEAAAYKRMHEDAECRIAHLEEELRDAHQRYADTEMESRVPLLAQECVDDARSTGAAAALQGRLAAVAEECGELRQRARDRSEEAATLQQALQEVEGERDAQVRQIVDLQARAAHAEAEAFSATAALAEQSAALQAARDAAQGHSNIVDTLRHALSEQQERGQQLQEAQRTSLAEATEQAAEAAAASRKTVEHYKKKARHLAKQLAEAERELAVLGEECARLRSKEDELCTALVEGPAHPPPRACEVASPVHTTRVRADSVSRDLSDALLSAHRHVALTTAAVSSAAGAAAAAAAAVSVGLPVREPPDMDALSLYSRVSAIEHADRASVSMAEGGTAAYIASAAPAADTEPSPSSPSAAHRRDAGLCGGRGDGDQSQQRATAAPLGRGTSAAPARARSPLATHALDTRFFDPTIYCTSGEGPLRSVAEEVSSGAGSHLVSPSRQRHRHSQRGVSQSDHASRHSPGARGRTETQLPSHADTPRSLPLSWTAAAAEVGAATSVAALAQSFLELPAPSLYYHSGSALGSSDHVEARVGADVQFSNTAGRLLVSKRGRRVHRPVCAGSATETSHGDMCCAAMGSMSHTMYASHMSAKGLYHLQHVFCMVVRVLVDCDGDGDILVGFADRYVPMESFGAKANAHRYHGCLYLSLRSGSLFSPAQDVSDGVYDGWAAAAGEAAERRSEGRTQQRRRGAEATAPNTCAADMPDSGSAVSPVKCSPSERTCQWRRQYAARAGDEILCTLRTDERTICYSWNGVDCGVAFRGVPLSPSLYPCVEVNVSGGAVELL